MSTIDRERSATVPPLAAGQRLDRAIFHERYEAMPPGSRFELIGGVVVIPSPVGTNHGKYVYCVTCWLGHYNRGIPGVQGGCDSTFFLDELAETQPDIHLRILPEFGGQTRIEGGYLAGAPELVVEVANTSKPTDLGTKREDYRRTGVVEYLVVTIDPDEIFWFVRRGDQFDRLAAGPDGVYRSETFPGLWLDQAALFETDLDAMLATLDLGRATPEFTAFAARLNGPR